MSVRLKLTLSYAGFLMVAGVVLLAAMGAFYLRGLPDHLISTPTGDFSIDRSALVRAFVPFVTVALAFLLGFGLLGGWFLAGRVLAPLTPITDATRAAAAGVLSRRIRLPGRRDELRDLADAFDAMLAQLEAHVAEQQRFAANASHELRTPLAIMQTLLEVARADPDRAGVHQDLVDRLHVINTRAIGLTEALLLLGRADRRAFTREAVELSLLAEEATETLLPFAEEHGVTVDTSGGPAPTLDSPALLLQLTTNLVHNAIVHNRRGGTVGVTTGVGPEGVVLTVENTGEVVAPDVVSTLAEPFRRGTDRVRAGHAGAGLGLAIVRSITLPTTAPSSSPRAPRAVCA